MHTPTIDAKIIDVITFNGNKCVMVSVSITIDKDMDRKDLEATPLSHDIGELVLKHVINQTQS